MELRLLDIEESSRTDHAKAVQRLARRCQHAAADSRLTSLGYRFYPMPGSEVPSFFCKRFEAGERLPQQLVAEPPGSGFGHEIREPERKLELRFRRRVWCGRR